MRQAIAAVAALGLATMLAACDRNGGAAIMVDTAADLLRGEPDAEELARNLRFEEAGISFDYPAVLRRRESTDADGARRWSLEYGMFELALHADPERLRSQDYLGVLAESFAGGDRLDAEGPGAGRSALLCGQRLTAVRIRLKIGGDWSELQGFDLPAPSGGARMLVFDDEPVDSRPSAVAAATWERVLGSLRCDPSFVPGPSL
jgi:hypothetical protein